ncbi:MAG TPA: hypothetical protein VHE35_33310 [Kofleriaceae bacterium]|nr:hypothetical protein [Kofleriaceae bacterium]
MDERAVARGRVRGGSQQQPLILVGTAAERVGDPAARGRLVAGGDEYGGAAREHRGGGRGDLAFDAVVGRVEVGGRDRRIDGRAHVVGVAGRHLARLGINDAHRLPGMVPPFERIALLRPHDAFLSCGGC